ncbi:MAG: PASTA domain-containing protein, partial [Actinomycetota bacterium]|nr:PASTA domain-containing protein [Actinomycetota bacterium]
WLWGMLTLGLLGALVALVILLVNFVQNTTSSDTDNLAIEQIEPVSPTGIIVPLVIDLDSSQAIALLESRGLQAGRITTEVRNDVPSDRVLSQFPLQGTEMEEGEAVALVISVGPESIQAPIVVGLTE